jgi:photosystem II stability/assembly factor-like uncharacterized protein
MRQIFTIFLLLISAYSFGQKTGKNYLPTNSNNAPRWMAYFYKDSITNVNVYELDKQVHIYEKAFERDAKNEISELNKTGEEIENEYILYYKRWRLAVDRYIKEDGRVDFAAMQAETSESFTKSNIIPHPKKIRGANSTWSLLGPENTFWRKEHDPNQPEAPWQVNVYAIAMAPSNHDVLYCAVETGGIFKTTNKGLNWSLVLDQPHTTATFLSIAVDPTNPDIVYVGRNNLIRKSMDGGVTWSSKTLASGDINAIAIKPSNPLVVLLGTENGILRSVDSGATYTSPTGGTTGCYDLKFNPLNDNKVVSLSKSSSMITARYSTDGGATFTISTGFTGKGLFNASGARLSGTPADSNRWYAVLLGGGTSSPNKPYIYRSTDGGVTWDTTVTGILNNLTGNSSLPLGMSNGQGYYDLDICANPLNADEVIVGTTSSYKSINGGLTFTPLGGYQGPNKIHPDIQEIISEGNDTWISTDGGANYSNNFFNTGFDARVNGIFGVHFWGFNQGWNEDIVGGGRYHNGNTAMYENYPLGHSLRLGGGEAGTGYYMMGRTRAMVFSDLDPGLNLPATINGVSTSFSFNKIPNEDGYGSDASEVEFLPTCFNTMYVGTDSMLWKSSNGGISWTSLHSFPNKVKKFEVSRSSPNVIYVAATNSLWKSTDTGITWTQLTVPTGSSYTRLNISVDFENPDNVWIQSPSSGNGKKIYKSVDGGATWIDRSTTALDGYSFQYMTLQQGTLGGIYLAADGGKVFYRNDTMSNWVDFSTNLPKGTKVLRTLAFYRDSKLRLAGNRGIWEVDFYEPSTHIVQPTVDRNVSVCTKDTLFFDDYSVLDHSTATWNWSFPGASFVSATNVRNPKVLYGGMGSYNVTLTVTQNGISKSKTINNMVTVMSDICSPDTIPGHALSVNAQDNFAYSNTVNIPNTRTYTMMAWVKGNGTQVNTAGILSLGTDSGNVHLNTRSVNADSTQLGYHHPDGSWSYNTGLYLKPNVWTHLALVIDSNKITVYKDGVGSTHTGRDVKMNTVKGLLIGSMKDATWYRNFKGLIDEVALFDKALSQNEIREVMNLTLNNPNYPSTQTNPNLVAYYQFNESPIQPSYDKIGQHHLSFNGAEVVKDSISTAPVGGGVSQRLSVAAGGIYNFANPGVSLDFPTGGTVPNGDLIISRINVPSDQLSSIDILPNNPFAYYVVRNYGTNKTFTALNNIKFNNVQGTNGILASNPNLLSLYKRASNAHGTTWGTSIDDADVVTNAAGAGSVTFSTGLNLNSFSQFSIGRSSLPLSSNNLIFNAQLNNLNKVDLNWQLENVADIKEFHLEHSTTASNFIRLNNIEASQNKNYSQVHTMPVQGKNYYRLKVVEKSGNIYYSEIKLVLVSKKLRDLVISPNPTNDGWVSLNFTGIALNENIEVAVTNALGQIISRYKKVNSNLPEYIYIPTSGAYYINCVLSNGEVLVKQFIVE